MNEVVPQLLGIDPDIADIGRQLDFTVDQNVIRNIDKFSVAVLSTLDNCLAC